MVTKYSFPFFLRKKKGDRSKKLFFYFLLTMTQQNTKFSKWWLTGFTQADGSFAVIFERRETGILPYRCRPVFILTQSLREMDMMQDLQLYLGVGTLQVNRGCVNLVVQNLDDILRVILPHFDMFPCRGGKHRAYLTFRIVCLLIKEGKHLDYVGFLQILDLAYFTNTTSVRNPVTKQGILDAFFEEFGYFPEYVPLSKPAEEENISPLHPDFVIGLTDGDGSFNFSFRSDRLAFWGLQPQKARVVANYTVVQDDGDYSVLVALQNFFGCGVIYKLNSKSARFQIENSNLLLLYVQPVFDSYQLHTVKKEYLSPCFQA